MWLPCRRDNDLQLFGRRCLAGRSQRPNRQVRVFTVRRSRRSDGTAARLDPHRPAYGDPTLRPSASGVVPPLDRDLLDAVKDLDEHGLRRLQILTRAQLERTGAIDPTDEPSISLRKQMVRCGKSGCTKCPHGPYWYAYWTEAGKRRSRYIGRLLDESL